MRYSLYRRRNKLKVVQELRDQLVLANRHANDWREKAANNGNLEAITDIALEKMRDDIARAFYDEHYGRQQELKFSGSMGIFR